VVPVRRPTRSLAVAVGLAAGPAVTIVGSVSAPADPSAPRGHNGAISFGRFDPALGSAVPVDRKTTTDGTGVDSRQTRLTPQNWSPIGPTWSPRRLWIAEQSNTSGHRAGLVVGSHELPYRLICEQSAVPVDDRSAVPTSQRPATPAPSRYHGRASRGCGEDDPDADAESGAVVEPPRDADGSDVPEQGPPFEPNPVHRIDHSLTGR